MFEIKQVDRSNFTESSMDSFDRYQEVKKFSAWKTAGSF